jgi:hypothetical protein
MNNQRDVKDLGEIIPGDPEHISGGFGNPKIQKLVMDIGDICISKNIKMRIFWVPRELNDIADYMSKVGVGDVFSFTVQPWVVDLLVLPSVRNVW